MATANRRWSEPALEAQDFGINVAGFSPYTRYKSAYFRPGEQIHSAKGVPWRFGKATAVIAVTIPSDDVTPITPTVCTISTAGVISAGTGWRAYAPFAVDEYGWLEDADGPIQ